MDMKDKSLQGGFDEFDESEVALKTKKPKRVSFTITHDAETKELMDDIQWLQQYVVKKSPVSQGDVISEALELLADKIGYDKLKKEYEEDLASATITAGRKSRR